MSNVQAAIERAKAEAGNIVPNTEVAPATAGSAAVPATVNSNADLMNNTSSIDLWLKLTEDGVKIGDDPKLHESVTFLLDLTKVDRFYQVVYGNPPTYVKSRDRVTDLTGRPWTDVLQMAAKIDPRAKDNMTATIVLELPEDLEGKNGTLSAGTEVGYTLPFMGTKEFSKMLKVLAAAGEDIEAGTFFVDVTAAGAANAKGQKYAKIQFSNARPA